MSALTTRRDARERLRKAFEGALDGLIPADESVPLKGTRFTDFEDQVEALARAVLPMALEERAALEGNTEVSHPGCCPFCGSARVYLKKKVTQAELLSPQGEVVLRKQHARCRSCGGSFSPSGSRLGVCPLRFRSRRMRHVAWPGTARCATAAELNTLIIPRQHRPLASCERILSLQSNGVFVKSLSEPRP